MRIVIAGDHIPLHRHKGVFEVHEESSGGMMIAEVEEEEDAGNKRADVAEEKHELMPQKMLAKLDKAAAQFDIEGHRCDSQRLCEAYAVHIGSMFLSIYSVLSWAMCFPCCINAVMAFSGCSDQSR